MIPLISNILEKEFYWS